jgi:acetyl esterase
VTEYGIDGPNGKITLRVYLPRTDGGLLPALVWLHGGGFVVGSLESGDGTCRALAARSGAAVVAVDYRKCPEYDLYAGRNDAIEAITWLAANGAKVGVDATRLAVGGDSAGGNIAAVIALHLARNERPALRLQVLVYPATHLGAVYPSRAENGNGLFLTEEKIEWFTRLMGDVDFNDPLLSPMLASSLKGVAPAIVVTAGFDPLRDEGLAYAERLRREGVVVESLHYPGQIHGFLSMDSALAQARHALDRIARAVAVALEPTEGLQATSGALPDSAMEPKAAALNAAYGNLLSRQLLSNYQRGLNALLFAVASVGYVKDAYLGFFRFGR